MFHHLISTHHLDSIVDSKSSIAWVVAGEPADAIMENQPSSQTALQEIASLLLVLHDQYLTSEYPLAATPRNMVLRSLIQFVIDIGLTDIICVVDIERLRRHVMQGALVAVNGNIASSASTANNSMGYESFYDWLRKLSSFIFTRALIEKKVTSAGKRELHHLLTDYIIPFSSQLDQVEQGVQSAIFQKNVQLGEDMFRRVNVLTDQALLVITEYSEFLQLLYLDVLKKVRLLSLPSII